MSDEIPFSDEPPFPAWFWEVLESSGRSLQTLCRKLEQFPKTQLERYHLIYDAAKDYVNPVYVDDCDLSRDCSEDHGDDFAAWVVMQGQEFYERVRAQPQEIEQYLDTFEEADSHPELQWEETVDHDGYQGYARPDFIAFPIYKERFDEDLNDVYERDLLAGD